MSIKVLHYTVRLQVPPTNIVVCFGDEMLRDAVRLHGGPWDDDEEFIDSCLSAKGTFAGLDSAEYPLLIHLPEEYCPLVTSHECLHCAVAVHDYMGSNIVLPDNDEVLCYTMDAIHLQIKELYDAHKK